MHKEEEINTGIKYDIKLCGKETDLYTVLENDNGQVICPSGPADFQECLSSPFILLKMIDAKDFSTKTARILVAFMGISNHQGPWWRHFGNCTSRR